MIKKYKPTTPGRRKASVDKGEDLTKKRPEKGLIKIKKSKAGRSKGRITVRHRGGGVKRFYRIIDFKRNKFDKNAKVLAIEYDPNRSARIALIRYSDGEKIYIIAPEGLKVDQIILSSQSKIEAKIGNRMKLQDIPIGTLVYNIELEPGKGGEIVRAAGMSAQLMAVEGNYATFKLPSKEIRKAPKDCMATIGRVSFSDHRLVRLGKAGRKRHLGIRPTVRGKAMNPVDHPHGGGEGRAPIGLKSPKTAWGKPAYGVKTRKKKKKSDRLIIKRRKK